MKRLLLLLAVPLVSTRPLAAQRVTEYTIPSAASSPGGIALGGDGRIWFTETTGNRVAKITAAGAIQEYQVPTASSAPTAIALGCDGNVWFLESATSANKIASVTPAGTFDEHALPSAAAGPKGLVCGPGHSMWFTESAVNKLGTYPPLPFIGEFDPAVAGGVPWGITFGVDGNLWYTERSADVFVATNVTTSVGHTYTLDTGSHPQDVVVAADAAVWVLENGNTKVFRRAVDGAVLPVTLSAVGGGLAAGPRNEVWVSLPTANKVARVSPTGAVVEYTMPTAASQPTHLAFGGDGNLWITEVAANKIAKLVTERPGDANGDGVVNVSDVFYLINFLFAGGPAPKL